MKRYDWPALIKLLLAPGLLILLGLVLIVNPDSAAALVAKIIGWFFLLTATGLGLISLLGDPVRRARRVLLAVIGLAAGIWLLLNPLVLAANVGRILGLLLIVNGLGDLLSARRRGIVPLAVAAVGAILVLLPMTTSRIFFTILGLLVLFAGVTELADRLRRGGHRDDPDIIDV